MTSNIPPDALARLAVFPLPNAVLIPRALLPLHIFEPRYRDMTRDVLAGSKLMAIARLRPGYESQYEGRPDIYPIAGVGEVVASEHMEDGRYHLMLRGVARVNVATELPPDCAYRVANATLLPDAVDTAPAVVSPLRQQLTAKCEQLADAIGDQGKALRALVRDDAPAGSYVDLLGGALITDVDQRQAFLEELAPAERLDHLLTHVSHLLTRLGSSEEMLN